VIEHEERELIESIIEFGDTLAREVMVPRPDMVTLSASDSVTSALDTAIEHGYSRFPVIGENLDEVVGIAYTKDLMRVEREGRGHHPTRDLARTAHFVPETKPVASLMREMQTGKFHMAVLVDEYGGIAGLVTLEDCIEELVGDIFDEYDVEDSEVERLADGELRVDGGLSIDELNELLDLQLPDDDWDTVGGFLLSTLGHVPQEGENVDKDGYGFAVEKMEGHRIALVRVTRPPADRTAEDS
jgi:CBS domain containing-hemolysin-like protein